jgi:tetratricopeptide (TPR) repeat protein
MGLASLAGSDCPQAEHLFTEALRLLPSTGRAPAAGSTSLRGKRGFALVCAGRHQEGASLLQEVLGGAHFPDHRPRFVNALGFALFHLHDYQGAGDAFEAGTTADPMNPILWSNLAAARMVSGKIGAADDALDRAVELSEPRRSQMEDYRREVFLTNAQLLASYKALAVGSGGKVGHLTLPRVELWWNEDRQGVRSP